MRRSWFLLFSIATACQRLDDGEGVEPTSIGTGSDDGASEDETFQVPGTGTFAGGDDQPSSECDPVLQAGCSGGEKCTAISSGGAIAYACVPAGNSDVNSTCAPDPSGADSCQAGLACLGTSSGLCLALCQQDSDCDDGTCVQQPGTDIPHCAVDCSPFSGECPSPLSCRRNEDRFSCRFAGTDDNGGPLDPCAVNNDTGCAAGLACIAGGLVPGCTEPNCCTPLCDLASVDPCDAPAECSAVLTSPAPGFESIGACFVST